MSGVCVRVDGWLGEWLDTANQNKLLLLLLHETFDLVVVMLYMDWLEMLQPEFFPSYQLICD